MFINLKKIETYYLRHKKNLNRLVNFVVIFFLFLNFFNIYTTKAADTGVINLKETYTEQGSWMDTLVDCVSNLCRDSIQTTISNTTVAFFGTGASMILPPEVIAMSPEVREEYAQKSFAGKSLFTFAGNGVSMALNSQPTVDIQYALASDWVPGYADTGNSVYAASGYALLGNSGITEFWNYSRNIAYVLFVVILMAAGFMIMFRNKVGGQMAVTVYNTIPNVILGLILVTFSFAIVGVILNISGLLTLLAHGILNVDPGSGFYVGDIGSIWGIFIKGTDWRVTADAAGVGTIIVAIAAGISGLPVLGVLALVLLIIAIIIFGFYIFAFLKVWWMLFKTYLSILIDTVAGPVILAASVFPGNSKMMVGWFNRIIRNALVFPAVFFIINASLKLTTSITVDMNGLINGSLAESPSGTGTAALNIMKMFLPLAAIYFAAEVPKVLEEIFPSQGSQGLTAALQGTRGSFAKIPLIGGMFAGGGK
jgi:hypothetical protein